MDNKSIESSNFEAKRANNNIDKKNNTSIEVETNVTENKEANIEKEEKKVLNDDKNNTELKSTKPAAKEKNKNMDKGYFFIQLASVTDMKLIEPEWKRLKKIYIELSKMKYNYKRVKLKNGKTFYRLFVGEFSSKEAAKDFCKMVLKKNTCIIKYYD